MAHGEPRVEDVPEGTREALLEAGTHLLARASRDQFARVLTAGAVSTEAGRARQTFYRYWETQADYVEDLVHYITDPSHSRSSDALVALESEADGLDTQDPAAEIRRMSEHTFERFTGDPAQAARTLLWTVHPNDELVADRVRDLYRSNDTTAARGFEAIGGKLGIEPRPPFTHETVALLFNALRSALLLHLGIDPDRVPESFFGDVMVAVTNGVTRRIDDPDDALDVDDAFRRDVLGPGRG
jgi:AcrR family transcriptional regulator